MPQANTQPTDLIEIRTKLIDALGALAPEHPRASAEILRTFLEMQSGVDYSLSQIGNNLRILKRKGVVECIRIKGHKFWALTGKDYAEDEVVKVLIAFPKQMHDDIVFFKKLGGKEKPLSKTAFVVNMVAMGLRNLDLFKEQVEYTSQAKAEANALAEPNNNAPGQVLADDTGMPQPPGQPPGEPRVPEPQ